MKPEVVMVPIAAIIPFTFCRSTTNSNFRFLAIINYLFNGYLLNLKVFLLIFQKQKWNQFSLIDAESFTACIVFFFFFSCY